MVLLLEPSHLKELSASLEEDANLGGEVETRPTGKVEVKSLRADDPTGSEVKYPEPNVPADPKIQSPGVNDSAGNDQEFDKLDAGTSGDDN